MEAMDSSGRFAARGSARFPLVETLEHTSRATEILASTTKAFLDGSRQPNRIREFGILRANYLRARYP
jgi:hypothetical protein